MIPRLAGHMQGNGQAGVRENMHGGVRDDMDGQEYKGECGWGGNG